MNGVNDGAFFAGASAGEAVVAGVAGVAITDLIDAGAAAAAGSDADAGATCLAWAPEPICVNCCC